MEGNESDEKAKEDKAVIICRTRIRSFIAA
jgi:hypothetical protein